MDILVQFIVPGLALAAVFLVLLFQMPNVRYWIKYHAFIDVGITIGLMWLLLGTYSGGITASIAGLTVTATLLLTRFFVAPAVPKGRKAKKGNVKFREQDAHYTGAFHRYE